MKKGDRSRQRLIQCAAELFWKNGYAATGLSEILRQTGLPKGSFYFYFKSAELDFVAGSNILPEKLVSGKWDSQFLVVPPNANITQGVFFDC